MFPSEKIQSIYVAITRKNIRGTLELLKEATSAEVNEIDDQGYTLLSYAVSPVFSAEIIMKLLLLSADVHVKKFVPPQEKIPENEEMVLSVIKEYPSLLRALLSREFPQSITASNIMVITESQKSFLEILKRKSAFSPLLTIIQFPGSILDPEVFSLTDIVCSFLVKNFNNPIISAQLAKTSIPDGCAFNWDWQYLKYDQTFSQLTEEKNQVEEMKVAFDKIIQNIILEKYHANTEFERRSIVRMDPRRVGLPLLYMLILCWGGNIAWLSNQREIALYISFAGLLSFFFCGFYFFWYRAHYTQGFYSFKGFFSNILIAALFAIAGSISFLGNIFSTNNAQLSSNFALTGSIAFGCELICCLMAFCRNTSFDQRIIKDSIFLEVIERLRQWILSLAQYPQQHDLSFPQQLIDMTQSLQMDVTPNKLQATIVVIQRFFSLQINNKMKAINDFQLTQWGEEALMPQEEFCESSGGGKIVDKAKQPLQLTTESTQSSPSVVIPVADAVAPEPANTTTPWWDGGVSLFSRERNVSERAPLLPQPQASYGSLVQR